MIQKIKTAVMVMVAVFTFAAPVALTTVTASAACSNIAQKVNNGAGDASGDKKACGAGTGSGTQQISNAAGDIVNIFSLIVGITAIIMIIFSGFRYITSGGDSGKVGNAKNGLVYAIIGLIVVALAQVIVHFVLSQTGEFTTTT